MHYPNSFNIKSFKWDLIYTRSTHLFHHHWYLCRAHKKKNHVNYLHSWIISKLREYCHLDDKKQSKSCCLTYINSNHPTIKRDQISLKDPLIAFFESTSQIPIYAQGLDLSRLSNIWSMCQKQPKSCCSTNINSKLYNIFINDIKQT